MKKNSLIKKSLIVACITVFSSMQSQNVGVGTTSPLSKLHVKGQLRVDSLLSGSTSDSFLTVDANGLFKKRNVSLMINSISDKTISPQSMGFSMPWMSTTSYGQAVANTRFIDSLPRAYAMGSFYEFKTNNSISIPSSNGVYSIVHTMRPWSYGNDTSGGSLYQVAYTNGNRIYYRTGTYTWGQWNEFVTNSSIGRLGWALNGNSSINSSLNFIGTTDNQDFVARTNNIERFRILASGNIGIGTTSPIEKLDVRGNLAVGNNDTSNYISFRGLAGDGDGGYGHSYIGNRIYGGTDKSELLIYQGNDADNAAGPDRIRLMSGEHRFQTNSIDILNTTFSSVSRDPGFIDRMIIKNNGNVGIGTTSPTVKLEVAGSSKITGSSVASTSGGFFEVKDGNSSNIGGDVILRSGNGQFGGGGVYINSDVSGGGNSLGVHINGSKVILNSAVNAGNVGIGTTSPNKKLTVVGGSIQPAVGNNSDAGISFPLNPGGGGLDSAYIRYFAESGENTKLLIGNTNDPDDDISFYQSGGERLTVGNGGFVGIGTTNPQSKLDLTGIKNWGASAGTGVDSDGPTQAIIPAGVNGSSRYIDWPSGWAGGLSTFDIVGTSTFFNNYLTRSDRKLKENIQDMDSNMVKNILKLRPVTYFLKEKIPENEGVHYGFIAQEVREIFPSIVTKANDEEKGTIGMNYQALIAPLVKVVQIQKEEIDKLKLEIENIKKMIKNQ